MNKIAQKVGEEAVEVVIEAKDKNDDLFKNESADLLFHLLVLFAEKNISLNDVIDVLKKRHQVKWENVLIWKWNNVVMNIVTIDMFLCH